LPTIDEELFKYIFPSPSSIRLLLAEVNVNDLGLICSPNKVEGIEITPILSFDPVGKYLYGVNVDCK
jgi:hypothetical protein